MTIEIDQSRQQIAEYIIKTKMELAEHMVKIHHGKPSTTCHRCLSYQQGIRSNTVCPAQSLQSFVPH